MPPGAAVVVADAHIDSARADDTAAFHAFLNAVPDLGSQLLINGDLFEFWFEYRSVIPRHAFPTLVRLVDLVEAGIRVIVVGGNHDRWGGEFWASAGVDYHPRSAELDLAGLRTYAAHGDGIGESSRAGRLFHRLIGGRIAAATFRRLHPDMGFAVVRRIAPFLGGKRRDDATYARLAEHQALYARKLLERRADLRLVVLGHSHRARLDCIEHGRWYLNPGAWVGERRYALVTPDGPVLRSFP